MCLGRTFPYPTDPFLARAVRYFPLWSVTLTLLAPSLQPAPGTCSPYPTADPAPRPHLAGTPRAPGGEPHASAATPTHSRCPVSGNGPHPGLLPSCSGPQIRCLRSLRRLPSASGAISLFCCHTCKRQDGDAAHFAVSTTFSGGDTTSPWVGTCVFRLSCPPVGAVGTTPPLHPWPVCSPPSPPALTAQLPFSDPGAR